MEHCAAWSVIRQLAQMIIVNRPGGRYPEGTANPDPPPSEEDYKNFKRLLKPIPAHLVRKMITKRSGFTSINMFQVDQIGYENIAIEYKGNLLRYAVTWNQTGYLQILLDHGLVVNHNSNF